MASWQFHCKKCRSIFYLYGEVDAVDISDVACVECRDENPELMAFDTEDGTAITELFERVQELERRIDEITQGDEIEDSDDSFN